MLTSAASALKPGTKPQIAIIWRQVYGKWEFFARSPIEEAEAIVKTDMFLTGLGRQHYEVKQG